MILQYLTLHGIMLTVLYYIILYYIILYYIILYYIILYCIVLCYKTTSMCLYAVLLSMPEAG